MRAFLLTCLLIATSPALAQEPALPATAADLGLAPVPGYALGAGDELFQTVAVFDVDDTAAGLDLGGLQVFRFSPGAPPALKAHVIGRFSRDLGAIHGDLVGAIQVDGHTWYRLRLAETNEWYRYDGRLDAILQYMQPKEITTRQAMGFLAAFDAANGG
jgi:hypothetical protein